jgi:hypothetical protein
MHPNTITKTINVPLTGQNRIARVEVTPETTVAQMLQQMGLVPSDFDVQSPTGDRLLSLEDKPWDIVQSPHDQIAIAPSAQVG